MSKKSASASTSDKPLKIVSVAISRTASVSAAARGAPPPLDLTVEVENLNDSTLYVWRSEKGYAYDASTRVLSVQLAEPTGSERPDVKILSDHPRTPIQVRVSAKSRTKIEVQIPPNVTRVVPGKGPDPSVVDIVDEPIGKVERVDLRVQYATEPIDYRRGEAPSGFRKRLAAHGDVVQASITPTAE
jgi:hypothetical protein